MTVDVFKQLFQRMNRELFQFQDVLYTGTRMFLTFCGSSQDLHVGLSSRTFAVCTNDKLAEHTSEH